jgi:isopenicillin-N N-acyltransferase-like protein
VGVPRLLIVREILAQSTSAGAIAAAIRPDRSSSYNNLIAHLDGTIVNVEGSAGDHALLPAEDGWTVHTNHYVAEKMLRYETGGDYVWRSGLRYDRAGHLMRTRPGPVTPGMLKAFLRDHENAPYCLCRHGENAHTVTVFWCVIDLNHGAIEYGRGVPCECDGGTRFAF